MALILDFSVCQSSDCTEFTFSDNTGAYNATTNPYGWGAPNVALADVQTPVTLDITAPSGSTYQIDLILTTPAFPVDQPPNELVVDMSSLGGTAGDPFPDGIYTFVYSVSTIFGDYSQTITVAFYCNGVDKIYYAAGTDNNSPTILGKSVVTNLPDDEELTISFAVQNGEAVAKTMSIDYIFCSKER